MKNKMLRSALLAIAMIAGLVSCSKEIDNGLERGNGTQALQFSIKNGKGALVTYAIAEGDQWTINTIDVYAFSGGTLVGSGKMTEGTDYTIETSGGTSTLTATPSWLMGVTGQTVSFYFVANDATSTSGAHISVSVPPTETAFKELLTNKLTTEGDGKYGLITPVLLFSDVVADVPLTGKVQKDVELIRRDARFDIYNNMSSSIVVNKIYVSNANIQGHIFGTATGTNTPDTGSHVAITGPVATDYDATTFLATSVFHLYPTTLGKASANKTEMVIEATVGGVKQNFVLKGEMDVVANHRYILKLDPVSLTFTVTVADYEEGGDVETELGGDDEIVLGGLPTSDLHFNEDKNLFIFDNEEGTFTFTATSKYGTQAEIVYAVGDKNTLTTPLSVTKTSVTTYAGFETVDTYTVTVPTATSGIYNIRLNIFSPGKPETVQTIAFRYGEIDLNNPASLAEAGMAPTFAAALKTNLGVNVLTPEIMESTTIFELTNQNITSFAGIEYFQNLEAFVGNENPFTEIDFSHNPLLKNVVLDNCRGLTSVDFSKIPLLDRLVVFGAGLTDINLEKNPLLVTLHCGDMEVTKIDISNSSLLKAVTIIGTKISTLDISNNKALVYLDISDCPNLTTGIGWSGFNTANPANNFEPSCYFANNTNITWTTK